MIDAVSAYSTALARDDSPRESIAARADCTARRTRHRLRISQRVAPSAEAIDNAIHVHRQQGDPDRDPR